VDVRDDDLTLLAKRDYADHEDPKDSRVAKMLEGLKASPGGWSGGFFFSFSIIFAETVSLHSDFVSCDQSTTWISSWLFFQNLH
jgi:hypothetical protein